MLHRSRFLGLDPTGKPRAPSCSIQGNRHRPSKRPASREIELGPHRKTPTYGVLLILNGANTGSTLGIPGDWRMWRQGSSLRSWHLRCVGTSPSFLEWRHAIAGCSVGTLHGEAQAWVGRSPKTIAWLQRGYASAGLRLNICRLTRTLGASGAAALGYPNRRRGRSR